MMRMYFKLGSLVAIGFGFYNMVIGNIPVSMMNFAISIAMDMQGDILYLKEELATIKAGQTPKVKFNPSQQD